jgi:hypothetical protein
MALAIICAGYRIAVDWPVCKKPLGRIQVSKLTALFFGTQPHFVQVLRGNGQVEWGVPGTRLRCRRAPSFTRRQEIPPQRPPSDRVVPWPFRTIRKNSNATRPATRGRQEISMALKSIATATLSRTGRLSDVLANTRRFVGTISPPNSLGSVA